MMSLFIIKTFVLLFTINGLFVFGMNIMAQTNSFGGRPNEVKVFTEKSKESSRNIGICSSEIIKDLLEKTIASVQRARINCNRHRPDIAWGIRQDLASTLFSVMKSMESMCMIENDKNGGDDDEIMFNSDGSCSGIESLHVSKEIYEGFYGSRKVISSSENAAFGDDHVIRMLGFAVRSFLMKAGLHELKIYWNFVTILPDEMFSPQFTVVREILYVEALTIPWHNRLWHSQKATLNPDPFSVAEFCDQSMDLVGTVGRNANDIVKIARTSAKHVYRQDIVDFIDDNFSDRM